MEATHITWMLVVLGVLIYLPVFLAQALLLIDPHSQRTRDIAIGKGQSWRDRSHFKGAYALAWADILVQLPILTAGSAGVLLGYLWGYVFWFGAALIAVYTAVHLWVFEREYVYPSWGPWAYYTYFWGAFLYWGVAVIAYVVWRIG